MSGGTRGQDHHRGRSEGRQEDRCERNELEEQMEWKDTEGKDRHEEAEEMEGERSEKKRSMVKQCRQKNMTRDELGGPEKETMEADGGRRRMGRVV